MSAARIHIATIGAPHGVRGEVRLRSFATEPAAVASYGPLSDASGARSFVLEALRVVKDDMCVAKLKGVSDRDAAAALTHAKLYVARAQLPPADEGEFYHADLIGLAAQTREGTPLGRVVDVPNYGAGDLLEILPPGGGETLLLPFTDAVVPLVDVKGGRIVVDLPAEVEAKDG